VRQLKNVEAVEPQHAADAGAQLLVADGAQREGNGASAVARRLLASALSREPQSRVRA
jgi:hypothetical protein